MHSHYSSLRGWKGGHIHSDSSLEDREMATALRSLREKEEERLIQEERGRERRMTTSILLTLL